MKHISEYLGVVPTPEQMQQLDDRQAQWERAEAERWEAERAREERKRKSQARAALPTRLAKLVCDGEELTRTTALAEVEAFAGGTLVLSGPPGCGKTVAAASWFYRRYPGRFVSAFELERSGRYSDDVGAFARARVLVIDDLGNEFLDQKGNFSSLLDGLINERHADELDTVIATNLNASEFKQRYGERIVDRLREAGKFVSINEPSMRRKADDDSSR